MKYGNLTVIGTSHIAKDSVSRVRETILAEKPDIVAVELDHARLHALLSEEKPKFGFAMLRIMGITGFVFFVVGRFLQRRLGKLIGTVPGEEMKTAVEAARQNNTRVAMIDQPLNVTMLNVSRIGLMEKLKLVKDLIFGISGLELELEKDKMAQVDLSKVPSKDFVETAMKMVRKRYPQLYKALVADRNEYMAKVLIKVIKMEPQSRIVAVVGAGHEKEIVRLVRSYGLRKAATA